jgi:hypothetical protein
MEEKNNIPVQANAVQPRGRKLSGALNKSPSLAGLTRVSPGMYRNAAGKIVNSRGQALPQQPQPMQRPMANPTQMGQEMGNMPRGAGSQLIAPQDRGTFVGIGNRPSGQPEFNSAGFENLMVDRKGSANFSYLTPNLTSSGGFFPGEARGSQYTKPAITPPGGGTPQPAAPMTGGPSTAQQSSPEQLAQMAQQYKDARNYQPSFKETQGQYGMGNLQRQKFEEQARQRQRLLNDPAYMQAYMESVKQQG